MQSDWLTDHQRCIGSCIWNFALSRLQRRKKKKTDLYCIKDTTIYLHYISIKDIFNEKPYTHPMFTCNTLHSLFEELYCISYLKWMFIIIPFVQTRRLLISNYIGSSDSVGVRNLVPSPPPLTFSHLIHKEWWANEEQHCLSIWDYIGAPRGLEYRE